jgi:hypothetical protein
MSRMATENSSSRRFISPTYESDHKPVTAGFNFGMDVKTTLGLALGTWALRRFPKTTLVGALAFGLYWGLNAQRKGRNPFKGEGLVKNIENYLH